MSIASEASPLSAQLELSPDRSEGQIPRLELDKLTQELAKSTAATTQLRSSLRNALMTQRMLEAQARENARRFRKGLEGIRAACWQEVQALKQTEKETERDLRQL
eukprot:5466384-Pleurochrysis_carterae.AAC.1